eukprot:674836-Pyramimonas_sp.AAC.1
MVKTDQEHHPHPVALQAPADPRTGWQSVLTSRHQTLLAGGARGRHRHDQWPQLPTTTRTGQLHLFSRHQRAYGRGVDQSRRAGKRPG